MLLSFESNLLGAMVKLTPLNWYSMLGSLVFTQN